MENTLVRYETARLAKENGFNCEVNHYYKGLKLVKANHSFNFNEPEEGKSPKIEVISVPTQSQVTQWLKDVYGITFVGPTISEEWQMKGFSYYDCEILEDGKCFCNFFGESSTFEEAVEDSLQTALKLKRKRK